MPITTRTQTITPRTINRLVNALLSVKNNGGVISGPEPFLQSEPGWSLSPDTEESMQLGLRYLKTSRDALRVMLDTVEAGINARQESCATVALQRGIHSIPDEVLAHIFEVGHEICDDQETGDSDDFSVAVSQVNQRFRRTALMTPRIWRNLGNWMSTSQLQTYIDRSKAAELILTVIIQQHISLEVFFAITLPHHTRWSAFTYDASEEKHNSILPTIPSQISHLTLPRLRRLGCVKPWDTTCDSDGVLPEDTFATWKMPKLVHFHTTNASIKGKGFGKNLKSVECLISDQEYRSVLDEFGTWPNLTSLNLEFSRGVCGRNGFVDGTFLVGNAGFVKHISRNWPEG
ncbi:hypothetical protein BD410DRAFT_286640 [Rickenella mellea]|uniref:Uncharacterized protein n=1 Tax=Rickenella mellea TaxID=50990 RepID=A0A4Y7Q1Y9_9AGAM|nr:hypothetical protein BD410DRAFT_286640 [Rickenella mellea]